MGRLFDAVAALCGLRAESRTRARRRSSSRLCDRGEHGAYALPLVDGARRRCSTRAAAIRAIAADLAAGAPAGRVSARFHEGVAARDGRACAEAAARQGLERVVLSGGVFQNRLLLERTAALCGRGPADARPRRLPPNDGGIAYGQAAVAAARDRAGAL